MLVDSPPIYAKCIINYYVPIRLQAQIEKWEPKTKTVIRQVCSKYNGLCSKSHIEKLPKRMSSPFFSFPFLFFFFFLFFETLRHLKSRKHESKDWK